MKISAVVPVFSETDSVVRCLDGLRRAIPPASLEEILLIVAPRSTPACLEICRRAALSDPKVRFDLQVRNPGQGWALRESIARAKGSHLLFFNSDGETDPAPIPAMIEKARAGADVVIASRWLAGGGFVGYGWARKILNAGFQRAAAALFGLPVTDATFIYRLVRADLLRGIVWRATGHDFVLEMLLRLARRGANIVEVPTVWVRRSEGESKNNWRIQLRYVTVLMRERFSQS